MLSGMLGLQYGDAQYFLQKLFKAILSIRKHLFYFVKFRVALSTCNNLRRTLTSMSLAYAVPVDLELLSQNFDLRISDSKWSLRLNTAEKNLGTPQLSLASH